MRCRVQQCRGPNGERLKRGEWSAPVEGDLSIYLGRDNFVATLERPDVDRRRQVLYPLFDVRVQSLDSGLLVIGYRINPDGRRCGSVGRPGTACHCRRSGIVCARLLRESWGRL